MVSVLRNKLTKGSLLNNFIEIIEASNAEDAIEICQQKHVDLIMLDIDLGIDKMNGIDAISKIKDISESTFICLHSNRKTLSDFDPEKVAQADNYVFKTISRIRFLDLIHDYMKIPKTENIFLVEDNKIIRSTWELLNNRVVSFEKPEDFLLSMHKKEFVVSSKDKIVLDKNFGPNSKMDGVELAHKLRKNGIEAKIFLSSNDKSINAENIFDGILPKNPREALQDSVFKFSL